MIDDIPLEIFRIIQQYLNHYEYRQLLNTNSTIFQGGGRLIICCETCKHTTQSLFSRYAIVYIFKSKTRPNILYRSSSAQGCGNCRYTEKNLEGFEKKDSFGYNNNTCKSNHNTSQYLYGHNNYFDQHLQDLGSI